MRLNIKYKYIPILAMLGLLLTTGSAYAVTQQGAYATLVFGVGALNEITVYELTTASAYTNKGAMTAGGLALSNIEFNCSATGGSCLWTNASMPGGSVKQDETHPMVYVDNTGTTTATALNISVANANAGDACLDIRYISNQSSSWSNTGNPATIGNDLNTTPVNLNSSFTPTGYNIGIWLYGNFSSCTVGQDTTVFNINATFA